MHLVEHGEEITITRDGKPVARPVPVRATHNREAYAAIRRISARAEQRKFGRFDWAEWKSCRDQGRQLSLALNSLATLAGLYSDDATDALNHLCEHIADHGAIVHALWPLGIRQQPNGPTVSGGVM